MDYEKVENHIVKWISNNVKGSHAEGCIVGVSGGIDSAVVSTLCARTGLPTICVTMPINDPVLDRANEHLKWLKDKYPDNVTVERTDLTSIFWAYKDILNCYQTELAMVNLSSRIRMVTLYAISNSMNYLVVGTGNLVEDNGLGFFTKYGDGGVDISPIGELMKSEVYGMGKCLELISDIQKAEPSDDLWEDGRTDEDQIGATYPELEWAMNFCSENNFHTVLGLRKYLNSGGSIMASDQKKILSVYMDMHEKNAHKIKMPRVCSLDAVR